MKKVLVFAMAALLVVSAAVLTACGSSGGGESAKNADVKVGDYYMKAEKWTHDSAYDNDSTEHYGLNILILGEKIPMTMGIDGGNAKSGFSIVFKGESGDIDPTSVTYTKIDDQGDYKIRAIFYFDNPKDTKLPETAIISLASDENTSATMDLSAIEVEE